MSDDAKYRFLRPDETIAPFFNPERRSQISMQKHYCDVCEKEMTDATTPSGGKSGGRVARKVAMGTSTLEIEIMHYWNGTANAGDVCKYCLIDLLKDLDDRPKVRSRHNMVGTS